MSKTTLLLVTDNRVRQEALERILQPLHFSLLCVHSAEKALDVFRYTGVSVVLIDQELPGAGFHDFMTRLRKDPRAEDTHVIQVLPKQYSSAKIVESYRFGAVDYIGQPFIPEMIRSMVKVFVRLYEKKKRIRKLLLNILPREVMEELELKKKVKPKRFASATVLFTDFVAFTLRTKEMSPVELVNELDWYFAHFDRIISRYYLEKIKTIGDAYMCVSGVPEKRAENPLLAVLSAFEIASLMERVSRRRRSVGRPAWDLRIGLHTGQLVAGVIGKSKFAYDIWGDTVNTANRICAACEPGRVNISASTYEKIKEYFECSYRGPVEVKHLGSLGMYYVHGLKPEYSTGGKGRRPNKEMLQAAGLISVQYESLKTHILSMLQQQLPDNLYYHGTHHTESVLEAVRLIGRKEGISEEDQLLLDTAALLHDCGYLYTYHHNEELAVKMARKILPDFGYTPSQIKTVGSIIRTTKLRSIPRTRLQKIMNDADYDYLGRKDYPEIAETLYREMQGQGETMSRAEWITVQITFLEKHRYYTDFAIKTRQAGKETHLRRLRKQQLSEV